MSFISVYSINAEKSAYRVLVEKPKQNKLTGRPEHRSDIKMNLQEVG
jgi:hypothetical protein